MIRSKYKIKAMLKVMTSNIRFSTPNDGINAWENRKGMLSDVINNFAPHILGSQEGRQPQIRELTESLNHLAIIDSHREWIDERMYPSLYINPHYVEVKQSGDIWLSETPEVAGSHSFESAFPRLCTWAELKIKTKDFQFICVNTHLDHVKSFTRKNQVRVMLEQIREINSQNLPLIFMGDFNESPVGETRSTMTQMMNELVDPWLEFNLKEETTYHKFKGYLSEKDGGARIDWIMTTKQFRPVFIEIEKYSKNGNYPSDHFPVKAEFKF